MSNGFDAPLTINPKPVSVEQAIAPTGELDSAMSVPLPEFLRDKKDLHIHETLDTNPIATFREIGEYLTGRYRGFRTLTINGKEGPRQQRIYDIVTNAGEIVSVWGTKILDSRIDAAVKAGLADGRSVMIQYLGEVDTGMPSAAHNFRVVWR